MWVKETGAKLKHLKDEKTLYFRGVNAGGCLWRGAAGAEP